MRYSITEASSDPESPLRQCYSDLWRITLCYVRVDGLVPISEQRKLLEEGLVVDTEDCMRLQECLLLMDRFFMGAYV